MENKIYFRCLRSLQLFNPSGPTVYVNCSDGSDMEIIITGVNDTAEWMGMESEWRLNDINDSSCEPTFNHTESTVTYNFNGSTCDPTLENKTDFFVLFFHVSAAPTGNKPVLMYDHEYNITCQYNRNGTTYSNFLPIHALSDTAAGKGDLL